MEIQKELANKIASLKEREVCFFVAICGAADLGKTYLSAQLVDVLNQMELNANYLTLDSYLMSRTDRIRRGTSGYHPGAYDLSLVESDLKRFKNGQPIEYYPYDHSVGEKVASKSVINPCSVLLIDGLHAMNTKLTPYINFSIFICTSDDRLKQIRHQADITKRQQTIEISRKYAVSEFEKYKQFVEPYEKQASVVLFLKEKWNYALLEGVHKT